MAVEYGPYTSILVDLKDMVATVTINRPKAYNALTIEVFQEMTDAFDKLGYDRRVAVIVMTGAGDKAFAAGADVKSINEKICTDPMGGLALTGDFARMGQAMRSCGKPIIARCFGQIIGGGFEVLVFCDLAIAADNTKFIAGEAFVGAVAIGTTQFATMIMGDKRARWLLMTDERIDAKTALDWGIVNKVVPFEELDAEVERVCKILINKFPWALRFTKTQLNYWHDISTPCLYQGRDFWAIHVANTAEMMEGTSAFVNNRPAEWMKFREKDAAGKASEYEHGAPLKTCSGCGAVHLPDDFEFCGKCGAKI
ncbi:MAG: enoyl-CoA hydratase/isomerase family protein [Chloroflexi bacterium]|nr:enoyl-CoA hydratase/isomerase family protein [Chloroflexota bacterium]